MESSGRTRAEGVLKGRDEVVVESEEGEEGEGGIFNKND